MSAIMRAANGGRLFRFVVVGAGAACLLFVLTFLLVSIGLPPLSGSVLAYAVCIAIAYVAQRDWTFRDRQNRGNSFRRYLMVQAGCAVFSGLISHVSVEWFGMTPLAMSAMTTIAASAASYMVTSTWVFPDRG
jgi:putative flippase GtrA